MNDFYQSPFMPMFSRTIKDNTVLNTIQSFNSLKVVMPKYLTNLVVHGCEISQPKDNLDIISEWDLKF